MDVKLTVSQMEEMNDLIDFLSFAIYMHSNDLAESARISIGSFCANLEELGRLPKNQAGAFFDYMVEEAKKRNHR